MLQPWNSYDDVLHLLAFVILSVGFAYVSRNSLTRPGSHGFARFFAWEAITALCLLNLPYWTQAPLSLLQLVSWVLLLVSIILVVNGAYLLRVMGKPNQHRHDAELLGFERTSCLVTVGAYKYIRHPLYSSLLFLAWGAFLKHTSWLGLLLAIIASYFLFLTAKRDEAECLQHFGDAYGEYMQGTKNFIPFVF